ncbi:MAG: DUF4388 domain-containing protein [Acidobacteriota bacterium]
MSVTGSLEDLSFPDLLQVIHVSRQSGTLILTGGQGERRVRFRDGLVCGATLGDGGRELEEILAARGLVDAASLRAARAHQARSGQTLSGALVALGAITQEALEGVVREELRSILRALVLLQEGEFRFEIERPAVDGTGGIRVERGLEPDAILNGKGEPHGTRASRSARERPAPPPRVLVVIERAVLRTALREELQRRGHRVSSCATAAAGLHMGRSLHARGERFDLISDLLLPDPRGAGWHGGLALIRDLRGRIPRLRAVLIGEPRGPGVAEAVRASGALAYLPSPDLASTRLDQVGARIAEFCAALGASLRDPARPAPPGSVRSGGTFRAIDQLSLLRGLIGEMRADRDVDIPLLVLRLAAEYFERGILFAVERGQATSTGAFGDDGEPAGGLEGRLRGAKVPLQRGSALCRAVQQREPYVGPVERTKSNAALLDRLGEPPPPEAALLPLLSGRNVFGVLYGDNARTGRPLGDLRALEIFLSQAGFALENAWLQRRLVSLGGCARDGAPQDGEREADTHA